jgi:hypothetical protein
MALPGASLRRSKSSGIESAADDLPASSAPPPLTLSGLSQAQIIALRVSRAREAQRCMTGSQSASNRYARAFEAVAPVLRWLRKAHDRITPNSENVMAKPMKTREELERSLRE